MSTFKEPFRVEGKKIMGYEIAEALGWNLPDVIIYPTGGGTGLVGMWKAFNELEELGWIDSRRPRMVQCTGRRLRAGGESLHIRAATGMQPLAQCFHHASGLRVPFPLPTV